MVAQSNSVAETMRRLGLTPRGANYSRFKKLIVEDYKIDISHFDMNKTRRQNGYARARTKEEFSAAVLVKHGPGWNSNNLRKKLLEFDLLENKCSICGLDPFWNKAPLVLQLDHINGDYRDNRLKNLRIVCPNCHAQTRTYCPGRKKQGSVYP